MFDSLKNVKILFSSLDLHSASQSTDINGLKTSINISSSHAIESQPGICSKYGSWLLVFRYDI